MYRQEANDAMIQTRVKSTTLATVARFFAVKGVMIVGKSFLMRLVLEEFEGILIKGGHTERVTSITDAREILIKLGLENLNPGGRLGRNYMEEMQREVYDFEGWDPTELESRRTKAGINKEVKEMEELAANPKQLLQRMEDNLAPRVSKQAERSKSEHDALGDVNNVPIEGEDNGQT